MSTARNMHGVKRLSIHKTLIIILLIGSIPNLIAQKSGAETKSNMKWFGGVNGGVNVFWGDIKFNSFWPSTKMNELQAGGGFVFGRAINPALKVSTELNFTALKGMKENLSDTLGFKTQALSFALKGQINPITLLTKRETKLAFYIEGGAGIMRWKNLAQNHSTNDTLSNLGWTNTNKEFGFYIPVGIKIEYQVSQKISAYFSSNYNFVFSDLLDGAATGNNDSYSFTALGINYHFGKQKIAPKLLPYRFFEIAYDSLAGLTPKKEDKPKIKESKEAVNPFSILYKIPETAPHTGYDIQIDIAKVGIPATGFFRLLIPSGFIPQAAANKNVSFTKLGHRYEYDFILPMNQDSIKIPIQIKLSEIERGTFPILIEGEIMDQDGNAFPIKFATYTEIITEDTWYKGLATKEKEEFDAKKTKESVKENTSPEYTEKINQTEETQVEKTKSPKQIEASSGTYHIQIMASQKTYADLSAFKEQHKIKEAVFISQADGWYRYNLHSTKDRKEAQRLCAKVRRENNIPQAFVVYYKNGKRVLSPSSQKSVAQSYNKPRSSTQKESSKKTIANKTITISDNKLLYRIEIAVAHNKPIPLYLLKNKAGKEAITEFESNTTFYYTVGAFENLEVAQAFRDYIKTQFKLEAAKIGQYQNKKRIKGIF